MREVFDRALPLDREKFIAREGNRGRVIVIAPTRAACETIELALALDIDTVLQRAHGPELRELARGSAGFGIVAGTGTGKTLAIRPIAEEIVGLPLRTGVVNREREATPEMPTWNVIIVTTGIARRWFQDGDILLDDTLLVDEIHQTSAELELCLALGKRVGCRFIWLSATVDPAFYSDYLESGTVIESSSFDPARAATVKVVRKEPLEFLDEKFLRQVYREKRGVGVFLPTRAQVEEVSGHVAGISPGINAAHYHGGEPIRVIRPFLEEGVRKPFVLAMTAAGQSALNVKGLDTVVIEDARFSNLIDRGRNVLTRSHLGANELLQMAGRVHGRVDDGRVFILSDRDIHFQSLRPTAPEFQLAGDSERVAITCADLGVRADELDLPVPLDRVAYRRAVAMLESRGIIEKGRLSAYGKAVEALPVDRPWAELLVNAPDDIVPYLAVASSIDSLHRMTRPERELRGVLLSGSDHLTAYNLYAEAYAESGYVGEVYGLPRHLFDAEKLEAWGERRGALMKSVEDAALAMASVYRSLGLRLPERMPKATEETRKQFATLIARFMPFDLVIDEESAEGNEVRVSRNSVCGNWGAIAGQIRYFADRFGNPRAAIEGTQIPADLIRNGATRHRPRVLHDVSGGRSRIRVEHILEYHGFELERESETLYEFPPELLDDARLALAQALARFEARHPAVLKNREAIDLVRTVHARSGGKTPELGYATLAQCYLGGMSEVRSMEDFRATRFPVKAESFLTQKEISEYMALPSTVEIHGRDVPLDYDLEETADGVLPVVRLRLPEKLARVLVYEELPSLDRPVRFTVYRGKRGALRAGSLEELQEMLEQPWTPDELSQQARGRTRAGAKDRRRGKIKSRHGAGGHPGRKSGPRRGRKRR